MKSCRHAAIFTLIAAGLGGAMLAGSVRAQQGAVPVMYGVDAEFETCAWGEIAKATAVRSGPGAGYAKTGKLKPGTGVTIFEGKGDWIGIAYGAEGMEDCPPRKKNKAYDGPSKSGWVLEAHLRFLAG